MKHRSVVIDISNIIWANYHKVRVYIDDDEPRKQVNEVLVKSLQSVSVAIENTSATQVFCATDIGSRASYRMEASPLYKSNRSETPSTIPASQQAMCGILDKFGIKSLIVEGYEADDIYAQMAKHWTDNKLGTLTGVSRDNDWTMAVAKNGGNVALYDQKTKSTLHHHTLKEFAEIDFGHELDNDQLYQYVRDCKTMLGDKSDVIESWHGVGKVGAKNLSRWQVLQDYKLPVPLKLQGKCEKILDKIGMEDYNRVLKTNRILIDPYHCLTEGPVLDAINNYVFDPVELSDEELDELLHTPLTRCWARLNAFQSRFNLIEGGDVENLPPYLKELLVEK